MSGLLTGRSSHSRIRPGVKPQSPQSIDTTPTKGYFVTLVTLSHVNLEAKPEVRIGQRSPLISARSTADSSQQPVEKLLRLYLKGKERRIAKPKS